MKTATALLIALNLQFGALGFALFVFADAWRHAADQELRGIELQLEFAREQFSYHIERNERALERLWRDE